jgi:hypothetical protein
LNVVDTKLFPLNPDPNHTFQISTCPDTAPDLYQKLSKKDKFSVR